MRRLFISVASVFLLCGMLSCTSGKVKQYKAEVVNTYPHDTLSFTQGLFFHNSRFYESTGLNGLSTLRELDLESGRALQRVDLNEAYFGEGSICLDGTIYMLTWQDGKIFSYDVNTLEFIGERDYPREGWGITTDGKWLYTSDGSSHIYIMDKDLHLKKKLTVTIDSKPLRWLNELEYINGKIWANVYVTDKIVIIDPSDGKVTGVVDCSSVYPQNVRRLDDDVLNGIAYDSSTGKIYITGKNWPQMYEIKIVKK